MPRGPRPDAPGVLHHVMVRGLDRCTIFRDQQDRADFVRRLAGLAGTGAIAVQAWAVLPNHVHLLVSKRGDVADEKDLFAGGPPGGGEHRSRAWDHKKERVLGFTSDGPDAEEVMGAEGASSQTAVNQRRKSTMSWKSVSTIAVLGAALLVAGGTHAQQPNPLDTVPDKMPFDIPYGPFISLERAQAAIAAAVAEAKKHDWKMNVAVVDSGGNLVAFERMDGAQLASIRISAHKARAAAMYRRETKIFENAVQLGHFEYIMTLDDVIASRGGFPLTEGGKLVGAIGCSGGTGSQDEVVCKVGAAAVNK